MRTPGYRGVVRHGWGVFAVTAALVTAAFVACEPPAPAPLVISPSDRSTVADADQVTGRRMALPQPDCTRRPLDCDEIRLVDQLDGFDLDPHLDPLRRPDRRPPGHRSTVYVHRVGDTSAGGRIGLARLVVAGATLYGQPASLLREATRYEIVVTAGVNGQSGRSTFTTMTPPAQLREMVRQLDGGQAYSAAGIATGQRGLDFVIGGARRVYAATNIVRPRRFNDLAVGTSDPLVEETVFDSSPASANAGTVAFGSFLSPQWIRSDRTIPRRPSRLAPVLPAGSARVGFVLLLPRATAARPEPAGGWPVAVFGPGVTRSKYDVFLAADENLRNGIATIAIDPVGHAYGPGTQSGVDLAVPPGTQRFSGFGRAVDVEGDGAYGNRDGLGTKTQPARNASIALRDGLRQTALDNVALIRAISRGVDVDADGQGDLRRTGISYYAQSLGGIYGTMLMAADPAVRAGC